MFWSAIKGIWGGGANGNLVHFKLLLMERLLAYI